MHKHLQKQFLQFHQNIKLDFEDGAKLREKRDLLIDELKRSLEILSEATGEPLITFRSFNQGSYGLGIGVKPLPDEDNDIDVALVFDLPKDRVQPFWVKQLIYNALNKGNRTVAYLKPCVRVQYHKNGSETIHVDFASYSNADFNSDEQFYLARGIPGRADTKYWENSDPKALINQFKGRLKGDDKAQFIRVIRALKRWKDWNFPVTGSGRPIGIAITACAMNWFLPKTTVSGGKAEYNDCLSMRDLVNTIITHFSPTLSKEKTCLVDRLKVFLSIPPGNNLFEKMTDAQMGAFKEDLIRLRTALDKALVEKNLKKACEILEYEFGEDFPIQEGNEEAERLNEAFVAGGLGLVSARTGLSMPVQNRGGFYGKQGKD